MLKGLKERLIERGWSEAEAHRVHEIMHSKENVEKHITIKQNMNLTLYWMSLIVLTICNLLVSLVLIPFLLVLKSFFVDIIAVILGVVFGLLFNLVINDIEHIEIKHHLVAAVFIPSLAIVNVFIMVNVANRFAEILKLDIHRNPLIISILYATAFIVPYIITVVRNDVFKKKEVQ